MHSTPAIPLNTVLLQMHSALVHPSHLPHGVRVTLGPGLPHVRVRPADLHDMLSRVFAWLGADSDLCRPVHVDTARFLVEDGRIEDLTGRPIPAGEYVGISIRSEDGLDRDFSQIAASLGPFGPEGLWIHREQELAGPIHLRLLFPTTAAGPNTLSGSLILVADDEFEVRRTTCEMLHGLGYDTLEARDGKEALTKYAASSRRICAVLLDYRMPRMDGLTALKALKALSPHLPVFLATGETEGGLANAADREQADGWLQKPFRMGDLMESLRRLARS